MERLKDDEFTRALLKSIRQTFPYSYAQIKSYEHFMDFELQRIIQEQSLSIVRSSTTHQEHEVVFKRVVVGLPSHRNEITQQERITPQECRDRGLMYQCPIFVDVVHKIFKYDPDDSMDGKDSNVHDEDRKARRVPLDETRYIEVPLAFMPAMVQSKYCHLSKTLDKPMECSMDRGGYFVVRQDRAIMLQERMRHNQIFLFESKTTNRLAFCEVRSCHEKKIRSTSTLRVHITKPRGGGAPAIVVSLPFLSCDVPLVVLYRLLGTDLVADSPDPLADVVAWVGPSPDAASTLRQMLHHETNVLPTEDLYEWLASGTEEKTPAKRRRYIEHLIDNELLPHLNPLLTQSPKNPFTLAKKRMFLGAIVNMLLDADAEYRRTGAITFTDRDDYQYKRIAMAGEMIGLLFRQLFRQFIRMLRSQMVKITEKGKTINMADIIQPRRISVGLQYSFATGIWAAKSDNSRSINNQGITQIIGRMNSLSLHSQLTRVNTAVMKEGNSIKKRLLGLSHYGYLCPSSTPEGQSCGLVKELSLVCYIRQGVPKLDIAQFLIDHADELGVDAIFCPEYLPGSNPTNPTPPSSSLVTVNGDIFGSCRDVGRFVRTFKLARRNNLISFEVTVTKSHFGVELSSDRGVLLRPVFVLSECRQRLDTVVAEHTATARRGGGTSSLFAHLHHHGLIEYVCSCEQKDLVIATTFSTVGPSHTHVEIHPSGLLGVCTSFVPHSDRNQAPRNMYSAAMVKQSINYSSMTQHLRFETQSHVPYSVQHPLVQTWFENIAGCAKIPNGCNVIAAIISRDGYNQEDSIVVNKDSVDRGLFHSSSIRTIKEEETTTKTDTQTFTNPMLQPGCVGMRMANYNHLDEQGTCRRGTVIKKNDVIVGKTMTTTETNDVGRKIQIVRDKSKVYMGKHDAVVDDTINVLNRDGNNVRKTKLRQPRVPEVGDKFCSRHGQKGTCGIVLPGRDMAFTMRDGITADIVMNPHAIPSRMTIGHLAESVQAKAGCLLGKFGDGTPFRRVTLESICDELKSAGFEENGYERMICGKTGKMIEAKIFIGVVYYRKLKHMSKDKMHARTQGPTTVLTRQPVEGRSRSGGLRVGEMERDCLIAAGASSVLLDRLFEVSDKFFVYVCENCKLVAIHDHDRDFGPSIIGKTPYCNNPECQKKRAVCHRVELPYSCHLLLNEARGINVCSRMTLKNN
tara:strand:+ start:878 stop:4453 length:3576 start_codon:yes stop_codon:yes gene_type:complete